jgi:large subunit ribosomal protein L3
MLQGLLGRKIGMTQIFDEEGRWVGVTVLEAGPCPVTQVKTQKTDGYNAVQLGFGRHKRNTKPVAGHLEKAGVKDPIHWLHEFRLPAEPTQKAGDKVTLEVLKGIRKVDVIGVTKGKGFQGVIKRWHKNSVTQKNLVIVKVDDARNLLLVRGAVPGPIGGYLSIEKSVNQHVPVTLSDEAKKDMKAAAKKAVAGKK